MLLSIAIALSCLLNLLGPTTAAAAAPLTAGPVDGSGSQPEGDSDDRPAPVPKILLVPEADLSHLSAKFMPPLKGGAYEVKGFIPPELKYSSSDWSITKLLEWLELHPGEDPPETWFQGKHPLDLDGTPLKGANPDIDDSTFGEPHPHHDHTPLEVENPHIDDSTFGGPHPHHDHTPLEVENPHFDDSTFRGANPHFDGPTFGGAHPHFIDTPLRRSHDIDRLPNSRAGSRSASPSPSLPKRGAAVTVLNTLMADSYPYSAIGKVWLLDASKQEVGSCTGALIASNMVLTARHCFPFDIKEGRMKFSPGYAAKTPTRQAAPFGYAYAVNCRGVEEGLLNGNDYIVCILDQDLPTAGVLGWKAWKNNTDYLRDDRSSDGWSSIGYPGAVQAGTVPVYEAPTVITKASDSGIRGKLLSGPPYCSPGWSGGPLIGGIGRDSYIVAITIAAGGTSIDSEFYADTAYHAGGNRLGELIEWARANLTATSR